MFFIKNLRIWSCLALSLLIAGPVKASSDPFYYSSVYENSPSKFFRALQIHLEDRFETDHPVNPKELVVGNQECNPGKDVDDPQSYRKSFNFCVKMFRLGFWFGSGTFSTISVDELDREWITEGMANYVGGQLIIPDTLSSFYSIEGTYWYLPSFRADDDNVEDLNKSSMVEIFLYYQKRFVATNWSWRLGIAGQVLPLFRDFSEDNVIDTVDVRTFTSSQAGVLLGLRWSPDKNYGGNHIFYADYVPLTTAGGRTSETLGSITRLGYHWYFSSNMAVIISGQIQEFNSQYDDEISMKLFNAGIKMYLF